MSLPTALSLSLAATVSAAPITERTEAKTWTSPSGGTLPYRLLSPEKIEPGKTYPVVLFLHGAGERGSDNAAQVKHVVPAFAAAQATYPCWVIAPQCPQNQKWVEVNWSAPEHKTPEKPSEPLRMAFEILDDLVATKPADKSRLYLTGLSMGGYGTWDALVRRPHFFAAAIPVCGGADNTTAAQIKDTPLWIFHGLDDNAVPTARSVGMWEALRAAGAKPGLTLYPDVGHNSWTPAFNDERTLEWLFSKKLPPAARPAAK